MLIGAIHTGIEALSRLPPREPALGGRPSIRLVPRGSAGAGVADTLSTARMRGFLAAPLLIRDGGDMAPDTAELVVALDGHLLVGDNSTCQEGASAARLLCSIYRAEGVSGFASLGGNFAFVLVDPMHGAWLVRDAAGTKPLFFSDDGPGAPARAFGSSPIEVRRQAGGRCVGDAVALQQFLGTGRPPAADRTLIAGIRCVPSGHAMRLRDTDTLEDAIPQRPSLVDVRSRVLDLHSASERLRDVLFATAAAQAHGAGAASALSGGIDSSSILAAVRAADATRAPRCFSYAHGRDDLPAEWNEREFAQQAAASCGAGITYVGLRSETLAQRWTDVCRSQDFPFGSPVVLAQAELFRVASSEGVDTMLSGHGPDILFGGGDSHLIARAADLVACGRVTAALRLLAGARAYAGMSGRRLLRSVLAQFAPRGWRRRRAAAIPAWMNPSWVAARAAPGAEADVPPVERMLRQIEEQMFHSVIPATLSAEECNARACGIDNRSPFLVRKMLELAASLASDSVVTADGATKSVLRLAMAGQVPDAILARKRAIGFAVPVLPWLLELPDWAVARVAELRRLPFYDGTSAGTALGLLQRRDAAAWQHAFLIWRWLSLSEWIDANDVQFD